MRDQFRVLGYAGAVLSLFLAGPIDALADTVIVEAVKDNTLIEDPVGGFSAGATVVFFIGRVGTTGSGTLRRGVIKFDTSAVPPGSTITGATVTFRFVESHMGSQSVKLHRLTQDWGEGTSAPGFVGGVGAKSTPDDATWLHTFFPDAFWNTPGGDYAGTASATGPGGGVGPYSWSSPGLIADVQSWVDAPTTNFGWCVRGNEVTLASAQKIAGRLWPTVSQRPKLTIIYTPPPPNPADLNHDGVVDGLDLANLLAAWGRCARGCEADLNDDDTVNGVDLGLLLGAWGAA